LKIVVPLKYGERGFKELNEPGTAERRIYMINKWRTEVYENLTEQEKSKIDGVYNVVNQYCKDNNIKIAYDDRAENFIGAITEYLVKSTRED
jgi:hypothetical protein